MLDRGGKVSSRLLGISGMTAHAAPAEGGDENPQSCQAAWSIVGEEFR